MSPLHNVQLLSSATVPQHKVRESRLRKVSRTTRRSYRLFVIGYVVMPEHVHLLVTEPGRATLARAIQSLKQSVSQKLNSHHGHLWQARYYDFSVFTPKKRVEKLKYIHRNPVHRGLVARAEDWPWSSYRHYALGEVGTVQIESPVAAWKRRQVGTQNVLVLPEV
ncbi:MAG TPA: transposase [Terriglobales bacterium]